MNKTIGILAHVDAGKTTFSEQLLYHSNSIKKRGRVDHRDAFLDSHNIEKSRGITVFADQATFTCNESTYYLVDTPGHVDFSAEMERAIQVMDYAVVIISAVEGIEGHTETVWQLLKKHNVPTFFFINKMDREGADSDSVIAEIRSSLTEDVFDLSLFTSTGEMKEDLIEFIAERDEALLERYMTIGYDRELWLHKLKKLIQENAVFPASKGSALKDIGIVEFLGKLDQLTEVTYTETGDFAGRVYKIRYDDKGNRVTFMKTLRGTLSVRDMLTYKGGEDRITEKVTQLRVYNGSNFKLVDQVKAGELFAVVGLSKAAAGDGAGELKEKALYEMIPALRSKVVLDSSVSVKEALHCFTLLDAEDPSLQVEWDEHFQEIYIHVMGVIQLEIVTQLITDRFKFTVSFEEPAILYKETITTVVNGYGHFEPLKHYAEVHLKIEPDERNSGIHFENCCHADDLTVGHQNLIRHHLFERDHHGILTGSALTDVKITLLSGRAHHMHTSGGDFREAAYRALRQGLEKTENILLEPFYDFKIKVEQDLVGRIISDVQQAHGSFDPPEVVGEKVVVTGSVPVATFMNYSASFVSFTHGKGALNLRYGGYGHCHNEDEVIRQIDYDKEADPEYTSSSVFCANGKGYTVSWDEADKKMHAL
ncbi:TetM/TetW/TetO/TetS family tetracycline resistance ribosomal protection protein [Virgibacillus sp. C22-A2]|uniref:TetM/TetW/TetO/TetS family tetracycline resistance ribosomal protection protein n=1 Tax=Virgibacillus tibetensis TaxID=3042313 RepID=A0ABU6KKY8_9BACI|nr:TetM/TetW/TetO/TetS family tetracycline resistance ribosomal protection protein [Virgibacillus sp. C22-A2]